MMTRGGVTHQYGYAGYYEVPYHVLMLEDAYPASETQTRPGVARMQQAPLNPAVLTSGGAGLRPYVGMDPSDPGTWSRPYNPQQGMFGRLHEQEARAAEQAGRGKRKRKGVLNRASSG